MKLKRVAGLLLAAPLLLLTACTTTPSLSFTANWYSNTNNISGLSGTYEELAYAVTFSPADSTANFRVEYDEGTYTTKFESTNIEEAEGNPLGYYYESALTISGRYYVNGEASEKFEDYVVSKVWFLGISEGLRPVKSEKTVHSSSPNPRFETAKDAFNTYYYRTTMVYNDALSKMEYTYLDLSKADAEGKTETVKLGGSGTYLDNEQMLLALRGLDLSERFSFRTFDVVTHAVRTVGNLKTTESVQQDWEFSIKVGENDAVSELRTIEAYSVTIGFSGSNSGEAQTLTYARCTSPNANVYRNVLLQMQTEAIRNGDKQLGTFKYVLKKAVFNNK